MIKFSVLFLSKDRTLYSCNNVLELLLSDTTSVGYTRSIFKRSTGDLNFSFTFSRTSCHIKVKNANLFYVTVRQRGKAQVHVFLKSINVK